MYNKKEKLINWFNLFWGLFLIINLSLFTHLAFNILLKDGYTDKTFPFPWIIGFIIVYILFKLGLQLGNGFIFGTQKVINEILFKKLSYFNYSGMVMFLANIILTYILLDSKAVVYVAVLLILLINIIGWITILRNHQKLITSYFYYFILYICALEIAPLIFIGSYLKD